MAARGWRGSWGSPLLWAWAAGPGRGGAPCPGLQSHADLPRRHPGPTVPSGLKYRTFSFRRKSGDKCSSACREVGFCVFLWSERPTETQRSCSHAPPPAPDQGPGGRRRRGCHGMGQQALSTDVSPLGTARCGGLAAGSVLSPCLLDPPAAHKQAGLGGVARRAGHGRRREGRRGRAGDHTGSRAHSHLPQTDRHSFRKAQAVR